MTEGVTQFLSIGVLGVVGGVALGLVYFGGLWMTVRRVADSEHPARLVMLSFLGRSLFLFGGFALLASDGRWARVVVAAVSCVAVRFVMARRLGPGAVCCAAPRSEGGDEE